MPSQFDRLSDVEGHRQVGTTVERAAGSLGRGRPGGHRMVFVATAALAALGVVALAAPSALAGGGGSTPAVAAAPTASPTDGAAKKVTGSAKAKKAPASPAATTDDVDSDTAPSAKATPAPKKSTAAKKSSGATPVPATESSYAKNIPAYPPDGRKGRRIVYSKALMTVWIVDSKDKVVRRYPVTGRWDRPAKGVYKVYSKSADTMNEHSMVTFQYMVRFAWGTNDKTASIGFHSIPIFYKDNPERGAKKGDRMSSQYELGLPVASGGCVRQDDADAKFLYRWSEIGDTVVVLPTAD